MTSRRPMEPPYSGRSAGALPRSPAERLEPTRPISRSSRGGGSSRFTREPRRSSGLLRVVSGLFTLLVVSMGLIGGGALVLQSWVNAPGPLEAGKAIVIPRGESTHDIAARLEKEGAISGRWLFIAGYYMSKVTGGDSRPVQLKAGDYQIPRAASVHAIIDILSEGKTTTHRVTVPEGLTSFQIVERLKADGNLSGDITDVPEEGVLLPDTYSVPRGALRQVVLDRMRGESRKTMEKLWSQRQKGLPLKTWEEAVVLASIVEKETGRNDERERVAAVFINRLKQGMRLESDPTIRYGIDGGKVDWGQPIMKTERAQKNAHNTYQIFGLPPTPICNPGRAALEAVLNPASTKELYFVADGKGGHRFAETLDEHYANVKKWRVIERDIRDKEKDKDGKDAKSEKDARPEKDAKAEPDPKGRAAAPPLAVAPVKAPEKASDKGAKGSDKGGADKGGADKGDKGKAAAAQAPPGATKQQDGSWAPSTESAQPKPKR